MSQSHNPADSQALLQSMLQKLKLQPGREGQRYLIPGPAPAASTCGQDSERGASNPQRVNSSPGNVFEFGTNGIPSKDRPTSAMDSNAGFRGGEIQRPGHGREVGRGLVSFPSQKDNTDGNVGENRVLVQTTRPGITPTGTGQLFPPKDADITSFQRNDGGHAGFGSSAMIKNTPSDTDTVSSPGQNLNKDQSFTPRVYLWASKSTGADTGIQENKVLHMGNGGHGGSAQNKDEQIVSSGQKTTSSSFRRKQQSSENKTKRWTQRIKDRWKDRPGSSGKKGKEEGTAEQKTEQRTEALTNSPSKDGERTHTSLDSSGPAHTEDHTNDGNVRPTSDFDLGLGSFSLLEEIVTGQEWAKFLNPNLSATSTNQRPSEELLSQPKILPNPHDGNQSFGTLNQFGGRSNQWSFGTTESSPAPVFSTAQFSPDAFQPMSMDVTEGKQSYVQRGADQLEPMEDGRNQTGIQPRERGLGQQFRPPSFVESANIMHNSAQRSRSHLNRKRHHQSAEMRDDSVQMERISDGGDTDRERSMSSPRPTSSNAMDQSGESPSDTVTPLYNLNSPQTPQSPSSVFGLAPRGVLKYSISQESESAMGTVSKRRRVEENRRVRFSEEVMAIASPVLDATESDEDSAPEEDSVAEQECEVQPAVMEQAAPARRPVLPTWILALKRKNTGRKHRERL